MYSYTAAAAHMYCCIASAKWSARLCHNLLYFACSSPDLDHLLHSGRGAGGRSDGGEAAELHIACFMGFVSFLASKPEVLRVAPRQSQALLNAAARANIQSATVTDTPLTDAGLDGTGQVVQVCPRNK